MGFPVGIKFELSSIDLSYQLGKKPKGGVNCLLFKDTHPILILLAVRVPIPPILLTPLPLIGFFRISNPH
jgi:hypothetical protein